MNYTLYQKRGIFGWQNNKKKMIKVKIINKTNNNEDMEENETEIEINNTESIANLIKSYCKIKKIECITKACFITCPSLSGICA